MLLPVMYFLKELKNIKQTQISKKYISLTAITGMQINIIILQIYWDVL